MTNINIIVANFSGGGRKTQAPALWQYDYGQILQFSGIEDLPSAYEVHFSNEKDGGYTKTQIGDENGVTIPDEYFLTGQPIYAWLFLHSGETDGETVYQVTIPINKRSRPADYAPTAVEQSAITQAIAALNTAVEAAEDAQEGAETAQTAAETAQGKAEDAQAAAEAAEAGVEADALKAEGFAVGQQGGVDVGSGSPYYHNNAKYFKEQAAGSATAAGNAQTAAETAQGKAETSQGKAEDAQTAAETAQGKAEDAQTAAETAQGKAEDAQTAAETAQGKADDAQTAAETAQGKAEDAQTAAETAQGKAEDAQTAAEAAEAGVEADALKAEGFAVGQQDGVDVGSGSPYYHNNAKYFKEQAAGSATAAGNAQTAAETAQGKAEDAQAAAEDAAAAAQSAMSTKADKVANATVGHVAALDANGNLTDNGNKYKPDPKDETMALRVGVDSDGRLWASGDSGAERFGVSGVGGSSTTLTRIWDAVGLTATPGTDLVQCQSDFDAFAVFNRKKCVGSWTVENGKAVFTPQAYEGDADYAEDGTMGDYVAVDVPPTYWYHDESRGIIGISGGPHPGWEAHPICLDADDKIRQHTYLPVYALAKDGNGHAVSLPGYDPIFGNYKGLWDAALTYGDGSSFSNYAIIEPSVVDHYEWLMMTVEFATTNMQTVMQGAVSMPYNTGHTITAAPAANKIVLTAAIGDLFVVGQTIYIGADHGTTPSGVSEYNHITIIENCNADGTLNASGTYRLITYDGTDRTASITANTTKIASRPWITGATGGYASGVSAVLGHTGSPVSNSDAKHPARYRWRENPYGNQNMTALDLFNARTADNESFHLDWYVNDQLRHRGAALYYPSTTSKPDLTDLQTSANGFRKLNTTTPVSSYVDGYIREEGFDEDLPCFRVPILTKNGSATTFFADYAYLVHSAAVRAVRRRGYVNYGAFFGPRFVSAYFAPSNGNWSYGAALYMTQ